MNFPYACGKNRNVRYLSTKKELACHLKLKYDLYLDTIGDV